MVNNTVVSGKIINDKFEFPKRLLRGLHPYKKKLIIGICASGVAAAFDVVSPMLLKEGIDNLQTNQSTSVLLILTGVLILAAGVGGVFRFYMRDLIITTSRFFESDLRTNFFSHLLGMSPGYYDKSHTGDLMTHTTEDIERVRMVVGPALLYAFNTVLIMTFSGTMMFILDKVLAMWILLLAPLIGTSVFLVARKLHRANILQQETYSILTSNVQEDITGMRVIKAFVREESKAELFDEICREYFKRSLVVAKMQSIFMPLLAMLIGLGTVGILWVGGQRIALDLMTLGEFVAFMSYLSLMTWPMIALGWLTHMYQRGKASDQRLQKILSLEPQFTQEERGTSSSERENQSDANTAPEIKFDSVTFQYSDNEPLVLSDINITIPAGSTAAIVGKVGSGKSSLVRLLPRLYSPQSGKILIDGKNWEQFPVTELRKQIGYVDQTPFLFSASLRENICIGKVGATDAEVVAAAEAACFATEIEDLPNGYDTIIGERGVTLSGGQQQRLTLARALLMDPPILVLDDALSAVDTDTEARILVNLKSRLKGRTTLFVTHRLAAAEQAGIILVLKNGKLAEVGSHKELLAANGLYTSMFRRQRLADELEVL